MHDAMAGIEVPEGKTLLEVTHEVAARVILTAVGDTAMRRRMATYKRVTLCQRLDAALTDFDAAEAAFQTEIVERMRKGAYFGADFRKNFPAELIECVGNPASL